MNQREQGTPINLKKTRVVVSGGGSHPLQLRFAESLKAAIQGKVVPDANFGRPPTTGKPSAVLKLFVARNIEARRKAKAKVNLANRHQRS